MVLLPRAPLAGRRAPRPPIVMAARHESFVPFLQRAIAEHFVVVGHVDAELSQAQRLMTAAVTFRPSRRAWVERFGKSEPQWPDWNPLRGAAREGWLARERHQHRGAAQVVGFSEGTRRSLVKDDGVDAARVTVVGGAGLNFDLLTAPEEATLIGAAGRGRVRASLLWSHVVDRMAQAISSAMTAA